MSDATASFSAADTAASTGTDTSESVGSALRRAREKRGVSLPQASRDLCLKEDVLRALESRQYSALPKVPYCFGFVRTYSRYLNLEPEEMVRRFKNEIGESPAPARLQPPAPIRASKFPGRAALTLSLLVAAAGYGGWYFYIQEQGYTVPTTTADAHDPIAPVPLIDAETAKKLNAEVDAAAKERDEANKSGATTSAPPPATIVIKATAPCWVYVHDQKGRVLFHKTMHKGDEFQVPTDQKGDWVVDVGNPAAVHIVFNGRILKQMPGGPTARRWSLDPKELAKQP
jgi:cytoskeletal protein RodZ